MGQNIVTYDNLSQAAIRRRITPSPIESLKPGVSTIITRRPSRGRGLSTIAYCIVEVHDDISWPTSMASFFPRRMLMNYERNDVVSGNKDQHHNSRGTYSAFPNSEWAHNTEISK